MTWQRIDEDTYIDDTLVTCAEYQLFIDEMREQGEYYQPDHWTSYQFPKGQAREPILGIRKKDAIKFCEWLTTRDNPGWRFRLPILEEVDFFFSGSTENSICGYWIDGSKNQFAWIGSNSIFMRAQDIINEIDRDFDRARDQTMDRDFYTQLASSITLHHLDNDFYRTRPRLRQLAITSANQKAYAIDLNTPVTLEIPITFTSYPFDFYLELAMDIDEKRQNTLDYALDRSLSCDLSGAIDLVRRYDIARSIYGVPHDRILAIDLVRVLSLDLAIAFNLYYTQIINSRLKQLEQDLNNAIDNAMNTYIDYFVIEERIAGRSPAFEGIRLVRERVR